jgi:hypothetical protein
MGLFINHTLVQDNGIANLMEDNIDGSLNSGGSITEEVTLIMSY